MSGTFPAVKRAAGIFRSLTSRSAFLRAEARGFDMAWARWTLSLFTVLAISGGLAAFNGMFWISALLSSLFGALLCLYFGHILLRRLQCSILEGLVLMALLGNIAGLVVTMPGMTRSPQIAAPLLALTLAWGLYAAVIALAQARLLGVTGYAARGMLLIVGWLASASPVLLAGAGTLWHLRDAQFGMWVSENMASWIVPLAACGAFGLLARLVLGFKAVRAAKRILA